VYIGKLLLQSRSGRIISRELFRGSAADRDPAAKAMI